MKPITRVYICDDEGTRFFGEGPCRLLNAIEKTGSLRRASQSMDMAYTKALGMLKRAETVLGFALTEKTIGGRGGGGSQLTKEAREYLNRYEEYREACYEANRRIYNEVFSYKR